jgi:O-antigen/teichoic acid export membrane protein
MNKSLLNNMLARQAGTALVWKTIQLAGVKGIFLARLMILARLLTPDDFGLLAIAAVALGVFVTLTDFGMIPALVQQSHVDERHYNSSWTVGILRAITIAGVVFLLAPIIAGFFAEPRATNILRLLALQPLMEAAASIKVADLNRNLRFRELALMGVAVALIDLLVAMSLAGSFGVWALVAASLSGAATHVVLSYFFAPYRPRLSMSSDATRSLLRFGRWIFLRGLITVAGGALLQLLISRKLGTAALGLYFMAGKIAFLPHEIGNQVVGSVAFPLYSRLQSDTHRTAEAFRAIFLGMSIVFLPIYALIIALTPSLVQEVLGVRWTGTEPLIQTLALVGILGLFGDAVGPVLQGLGRPNRVVVLGVVQSLIILLFVWNLEGRYGVVSVAFAWVPAIAVSQIISAVFIRQLLPRPFSGMGQPLLVILITAAFGGMIALGVTTILSGLVGLVIAVSVAAVFIGISLLFFERSFSLGLLSNLPRAFPQIATLVRTSSV